MLVFIRHREEIIVSIPGQISHFIAAHDVGIHIDRIDRIRDQNHIAGSEEVRDVSGIALGAV